MDDFVTLGANLKQARESQEITLEELEQRTRIRLKYLEAIEAGDFDAVGAPIQLRGFLRNYAHAVGLDREAVVAFYDQAAASTRKGRWRKRKDRNIASDAPDIPTLDLKTHVASDAQAIPTLPSYSTQPYSTPGTVVAGTQQGRRRGFWRVLRLVLIVIGAGALTAAIVGGVVVGLNELANSTEEATAPAPLLEINPGDSQGTEGSVVGGPTDIPTQPGVEIPPPAQNTPSFEGASALFINITAEQRSWLQVQTDGNTVFQGILLPGTGVQYSANERITVTTANAGGLRVRINNQDYSLGQGRVAAEQTFTLEGLVAPAAPATLAPSATSTITATFTLPASITATVTNTATAPAPAAGDTTLNQTSPTATFFFTPLPSLTGSDSTSLPDPSQSDSSSNPTPLPSPAGSTATPTLTSTQPPTATLTPTPTSTASFTPTVASTATPFLPPRETRTPVPEK